MAFSPIDFIFAKNHTQLDSIELHACITQEHSSVYEITEHPVETGFKIVDHKRKRPTELTITGVISNTDPRAPFLDSLRKTADGYFNATDTSKRVDVMAWAQLTALQESNALITVSTTLKFYEDMQIVTLNCTRDAANSQMLKFTANLREIQIVESQSFVEDIQAVKQVNKPPATKRKIDAGQKVKSEPPPKIKQSAAFQLVGSVVDKVSGGLKRFRALF